MKQIKDVLSNFSKKQGGPQSLANLLDDLDEGPSRSSDEFAKEKAELKELQKRLEEDKKKYKQDKAEAEELRHSDPSAYRQRMQVLDRVKDSIERQIDKVNGRISKLKDSKKRL